jgi:AcrR family transcriptional regulator
MTKKKSPATVATSGGGRRGGVPETDERVLRSKKAVLAATFQLLGEQGLGGASVDEVSKRSGVAKTTIYRHWPSRTALLIEACSSMGTRPQVPDTGSFKGDLTALVTHMAARLRGDRWATILPSIIDAAERDPEIASVHTRLHAGFMAPLYAVIERAQGKGEVAEALDPSEIVASVVGPLFYRRWFSRQPLDERFVGSIVEAVVSRGPRRGR